ncbi:hypothetical protein H9L19_01980 [Weissella diestrammenae]|uniref:Uncharacterized protein n=1 Tax=Weissella diestrammenae TaxID=1162633 RepID=A0A7G9T6E4_9LACO|nr:hypothetical protein [Weissella diestrammenae]MCM0583284.1 hypothetical protein [Weissella diestrammenae]QNN75669.1 hypothetical protein H9L19_01980 [Weissella diestrammenae]
MKDNGCFILSASMCLDGHHAILMSNGMPIKNMLNVKIKNQVMTNQSSAKNGNKKANFVA